MKKILLLIPFFLIINTLTVYAVSPEYDKILDSRIKELGVYDGESGIAYSSIENFSDSHNILFVAYIANGALSCEIYNDMDGIQKIDSLAFNYGGTGSYKMSIAHKGTESYLIMESKSGDKTISEFFSVIDDRFKKIAPVDYENITPIIGYANQKTTSYSNNAHTVYNFLNGLKLAKISSMKLNNSIETLSADEKENIRALLAACADVMKFDKYNYDYDTLMKYILCTHRNFAQLININSESDNQQNSLGFENISIVNGEFIDNILTSVFRMSPEHPPVNALIERGFCYNNGLYYYKNIFNTDFHTEIRDLIAAYDLGGNIFYVIFTDIYYEDDKPTPEFSFAIVQKNDILPYSLIRIGMGENLLTESDIAAYTPQQAYSNPNWKTPAPGHTLPDSPINLPILLVIISIGSVMLIISAIILIRELRRR